MNFRTLISYILLSALVILFLSTVTQAAEYMENAGDSSEEEMDYSWSFCAPVFEIISDADIFVVPPLNFVFYATLFLILLLVVAVVIFFFQSLG